MKAAGNAFYCFIFLSKIPVDKGLVFFFHVGKYTEQNKNKACFFVVRIYSFNWVQGVCTHHSPLNKSVVELPALQE